MKVLFLTLISFTLFAQTTFRDCAYLVQSVGSQIYTQNGVTTDVPAELSAYNTAHGFTGDSVCTIYNPTDDYPPGGNLMWLWKKAFYDEEDYTFKEDYLDTETYSIIMIKHCFASQSDIWAYGTPSDTINDPYNQTIYNFQWYVRKIITVMEQYPNKFFVYWNIPPIVPTGHSADDAARLRWFNKWMVDTLQTGLDTLYGAFPPNVYIYDYFELVDSANWMPLSMSDSPTDSHPNELATNLVAPDLVEKMYDNARAYEAAYNAEQPNIWYVDKDATGANTGRSWTDAWTSISDSQHVSEGINFDILQGGDTVYVSDGVYTGESGAYSHRIYPTFAVYDTVGIVYDSEVVIAPAWQEGHNDTVVIANYDEDTQWILQVCNITNLKLTGFTYRDTRETGGTGLYLGGTGVDGHYFNDSLITIDNWYIPGNGRSSLIYLAGKSIKITNCYIIQPEDNYPGETDPIGVSGGLGGHTIDGCTIVMQNGYTSISGDGTGMTTTDTSITIVGLNMTPDYHVSRCILVDTVYMNITSNTANTFYGTAGWEDDDGDPPTPSSGQAWEVDCEVHRDGIQISDLGWPGNTDVSRRTFTISNNLIIDTNPQGTSWNNLIYNHQNPTDPASELLIYNNILVHRKEVTGIGAMGLGRASLDPAITAKVFNNTMIIKGSNPGLFTIWGADSMFFANNLCVVDTNINGHLNINAPTVIGYCDYNLYAEYGGYEDYLATYSVTRTFSEWQGLGYDVNSDTANSNLITFVNKYGLDKADYYTTAGRDMGVDLSAEYPFLAYDILGNPRTGAWDIGALEFQDGTVDSIPSFSFTPVTNAELNTEYIATSPITGIDTVTHFWTTTGAEFKINYNGTYNTAMKTADPDNGADTVYVKNVTGGLYDQLYTETIVGGGVSGNFNVTTQSAPVINVSIGRFSDGKIMRSSTGSVIKLK